MAHRSKFLNKIRSVFFVIFSTLLITPAQAEIPDALYSALGLDKDVAPNVLYDALVTRYRDPKQGAGEGAFADLWEPIPFSAYMVPQNFYEGPDLDMEVSRTECVECHENVTPGWVHSWENSVHGNLDEIRGLDETDSRHYKKELIGQVETNLHSMGLLEEGQRLTDVGCIDCHIGVGAEALITRPIYTCPMRRALDNATFRDLSNANPSTTHWTGHRINGLTAAPAMHCLISPMLKLLFGREWNNAKWPRAAPCATPLRTLVIPAIHGMNSRLPRHASPKPVQLAITVWTTTSSKTSCCPSMA